MADKNERQKKILERVGVAFKDVPSPGSNITSHACPECDDLSAALYGKHWKDYLFDPCGIFGTFENPDKKPFISRDSTSLLTVEAFHFFLPVILSLMLLENWEADVMLDAFPGKFDPGPKQGDPKQWEWVFERCKRLLELMDKEQREITATAMEVIFEDDSYGIPPTKDDAIANLRTGEVTAWKRHGDA